MLTGASGARAAPLPAPDGMVMITLPVPEPAPPAISLPDLLFWWAPRDGGETAGIGLAAEVVARGPDRFAEVERRAAEILARVVPDGRDPDGAPPWTPRMFGGFAFAPGAAGAPPWSDFGDAWFALPRLLYRRQGRRAWLSFLVDASGGAAARDQAVREAHHLLGRLRSAPPDDPGAGIPSLRSLRQLDPSQWADRVGRIRSAIA